MRHHPTSQGTHISLRGQLLHVVELHTHEQEPYCRFSLRTRQPASRGPLRVHPELSRHYWHEVLLCGELALTFVAQARPGQWLCIQGSLLVRIAHDAEGNAHVICTTQAHSFELQPQRTSTRAATPLP